MKVLQNDIFGQKHDLNPEKEKKSSSTTSKSFPSISLIDGLHEAQATANAMLVHRALEKKLIFGGMPLSHQKKIFMNILKNELSIKAGIVDPLTATRDSLLSFYIPSIKK